ncbi:MAG TPA: DUF4286 family protein [Ferruginibacter sp.]|nr:DUF4286 family protein [Ferruginibacter sp.]
MIIYNVTIKIAAPIHEDWLHWLQQEHVPEVLATGCFEKATVTRLLEIDDSEGPTYAVQYLAASKAMYNKYIEKFSEGLRKKSFNKWGNQFIAFRSLMQIVQ